MSASRRASIALPSLLALFAVLAAPAAGGGVDLLKSAPATSRGTEMSSVPNPTRGTPDPRSDEYRVDDGVGERSIGIGYGTLIWLNHFQVIPFNGYISEISVAWGDVPAGLPARLLVFDDPNNDGNPQDVTSADLLSSIPVTTEGGSTDTFYHYPFDDVFVGNAGDHFYVGVCCAQTDYQDLPARFDETAPAGQSWAAISGDPGFDCTNPNSAEYPLDLVENYGASGNWMVRAGCEVIPGMSGTCCLPDGGCGHAQAVICGDFMHGLWYPCGTCADCPDAEACCLGDRTCQMLAEFGCVREGGQSMGPGSACAPDPCQTSNVAEPPGADALLAISPNPFQQSTRISFRVAVPGCVVIDVLDCSGRVVRVLRDGPEEVGLGSVAWDGKDSGGSRVASGVYFVRFGPANTRALVCIR